MAKDDRLYGRFTLDFPDHPKILPLSDAAFRALIEMTLYSRRLMTDGFLSTCLANARWGASVCLELASNDPDNPSLIEVEGGYQIHDFAEHQTTKAEIEALREKRKAAGRKGGKANAKQVLEQNGSKTKPETETETETETLITTNVVIPQPTSKAFEDWWKHWPVKRDKKAASTAFAKALKRATLEELIQGATMYGQWLKANPDQSPKYAQGWLNDDRWTDELRIRGQGDPREERIRKRRAQGAIPIPQELYNHPDGALPGRWQKAFLTAIGDGQTDQQATQTANQQIGKIA